jgi:hypothetical protein
MAWRVPPIGPRVVGSEAPVAPAIRTTLTRPGDGLVVAAFSLLAIDRPWPPAGGVRDPEGFAFTAVSPFY